MDFTTFVLLTSILPFLILRLYSWFFRSPDYWTSRGVPCLPGPLPIFGHTWSVLTLSENISTLCAKIYRANGEKSMVGFYKLNYPVLLVRDPELVKRVLQTNFSSFQHNSIAMDRDMDPLFGRDLLFLRGQTWKNSRAVFVAPLSLKRLREMTSVIATGCEKLDRHLSDKMTDNDHLEVEAKDLFSRYTTEVSAGTVFSVDGNSFADDQKGTFLECMKMILDPTLIKGLRHHTSFFLPRDSILQKIVKTRFVPLAVDQFFRKVVNDLDDLRTKDGFAGNDVLQIMLEMEKRGRINRIETLAHILSFFMESYETSSLTLGYVAYCLAKHQDVQSRLRQEVETVLAKHEGRLTYEAIAELNYLDQVINETFRFFPVAGNVSKTCSEKCRLEGSDGLAVNVEPGTTVIISIAGLHMDSKIWESPNDFRPERFEKNNVEGRHRFAHLPFSGGPRTCPGQRLAIIQVKAAISTIVRNYNVEMSPKTREPLRVNPAYFLTAPVGGLWIRFKRLKK